MMAQVTIPNGCSLLTINCTSIPPIVVKKSTTQNEKCNFLSTIKNRPEQDVKSAHKVMKSGHKLKATESCMSVGRVPSGTMPDSLCSYCVGLSSGGPAELIQ